MPLNTAFIFDGKGTTAAEVTCISAFAVWSIFKADRFDATGGDESCTADDLKAWKKVSFVVLTTIPSNKNT